MASIVNNLTIDALDESLKADLLECNLEPISIIFVNRRKGRTNLVVKDKNSTATYLMKWAHRDAGQQSLSGLQSEITFLQSHQGMPCLPRVEKTSDHYALFEYIESYNLRDWLIQYLSNTHEDVLKDEFKTLIQSLCGFIEEFYFKQPIDGAVREGNAENLMETLLKQWGKLLLSHPFDAERSALERFLSRVVQKLVQSRHREFFSYAATRDEGRGSFSKYGHGDFHLTNILVDKHSNSIMIIDWENTVSNESFFVDLCYVYPMLQALLEGLPKHQGYLQQQVSQLFEKNRSDLESLFFDICNVNYRAILTNRSFLYKASCLKIIANYFKLLTGSLASRI